MDPPLHKAPLLLLGTLSPVSRQRCTLYTGHLPCLAESYDKESWRPELLLKAERGLGVAPGPNHPMRARDSSTVHSGSLRGAFMPGHLLHPMAAGTGCLGSSWWAAKWWPGGLVAGCWILIQMGLGPQLSLAGEAEQDSDLPESIQSPPRRWH